LLIREITFWFKNIGRNYFRIKTVRYLNGKLEDADKLELEELEDELMMNTEKEKNKKPVNPPKKDKK
jgi:hypothetical protein